MSVASTSFQRQSTINMLLGCRNEWIGKQFQRDFNDIRRHPEHVSDVIACLSTMLTQFCDLPDSFFPLHAFVGFAVCCSNINREENKLRNALFSRNDKIAAARWWNQSQQNHPGSEFLEDSRCTLKLGVRKTFIGECKTIKLRLSHVSYTTESIKSRLRRLLHHNSICGKAEDRRRDKQVITASNRGIMNRLTVWKIVHELESLIKFRLN